MIKAQKFPQNPILLPDLEKKEASVYNPAAIEKNGKIFLFYRSERGFGDFATSRINLAISENGISFKRYKKNPVVDIEKKIEKMGCEDPRIIKTEDFYFLTYTAYAGRDRKGDYKINLCGAISKDLFSWKKIGILIKNEKSGAIVQDYKYKGKFVMYFGGKIVKIAFSKNLKRWEIQPKPVLLPRKGNFFDNHLVEGGPPPVVRNDGIYVFYNGKNNKGKFSIGLAIFDKKDPSRLLKRFSSPLVEPTEYWEKYGKVNNTVFATAFLKFKRNWLLYFGGADKAIGGAKIYL